MSDGNTFFSQACKSAEVPFPFPFANLLRLFLWILLLIIPFLVNSKILHHPFRFLVNFLAIFSYFSICQVGDNLEDPYLPYDPNELPLHIIQHDFNSRLSAMRVLPISEKEAKDSIRSSNSAV